MSTSQPAKSSSSSTATALSVLLQAIQTAAVVGILVVLAMILVQMKKFSAKDFAWNIESTVEIVRGRGASSTSPIYMKAVT